MPKWIHDRASLLMAKNPSMPEGEAWAIATQQAHATGHSPKGYGTSNGKEVANEKYTTPEDDEQKAAPKSKTAGIVFPFNSALVDAFCGELTLIAEMKKMAFENLPPPPTGLAQIKSTIPKPTMSLKGRHSTVAKSHTTPPVSPASEKQPVAEAPQVRT
jgi:hypothetical protein